MDQQRPIGWIEFKDDEFAAATNSHHSSARQESTHDIGFRRVAGPPQMNTANGPAYQVGYQTAGRRMYFGQFGHRGSSHSARGGPCSSAPRISMLSSIAITFASPAQRQRHYSTRRVTAESVRAGCCPLGTDPGIMILCSATKWALTRIVHETALVAVRSSLCRLHGDLVSWIYRRHDEPAGPMPRKA
jgi:hypothetical protein